jgi:Kinetochore complex Fta4 of Sim4 subunit, or CENP-50
LGRIQEQRRKIVQFQRLQQLLKPFENPQESIQPNIITRDGELGKELDRMRMLMARVAGRVGELRGELNVQDGGDAGMGEENIQDKLLGIVGT